MVKLAFLDTETKNLKLADDVIWEFGAVVRHANGAEVEKKWYIHVDLGDADPYSLKVGKYHSRHDKGPGTTIDRPTAAKNIESTLRDTILVVNNPTFDVPRLELLLRSQNLCPTWESYHPIDVRDLAVGYLRGYIVQGTTDMIFHVVQGLIEKQPWSGTEVRKALGLITHQTLNQGTDSEHTALGDARNVRDVYDAVMGVA